MGQTSDAINRPFHLAVYCSASDNLPCQWIESAKALGAWIGSNNAVLVYGGVDAGLMKIVATAANSSKAKIVGVVPTRRMSDAFPANSLQIQTCDLNDRKATIQLLSDAFVVLPGGYGTLDECMSAFSYINFTQQRLKKIILFNPDGLYDDFLAQLKTFANAGLMAERCFECLIVVTAIEQLLACLDRELTYFNTI